MTGRLDRIANACTILGVATLAFRVALAVLGHDQDTLVLFAADVPLLLAFALSLPRLVRDVRERALGPTATIWLLLIAILVLSFVPRPSWGGTQLLMRGGLVLLIGWRTGARSGAIGTAVDRVVVSLAIVQTAIALLQVAHRAPLGIAFLGESEVALFGRGSAVAPRGTTADAYVLAALCLLAAAICVWRATRGPRAIPWVGAAAIAMIPIGITYSRGAAVALGAMVACLLPGAVRGVQWRRALVAALLVGPLIGGGLTASGWLERIEQTVTTRPADSATDRRILARQAVAFIAEAPLTGIGTGRYELEYDERVLRGEETFGPRETPADVPLLVAADAGVVAGALALWLLIGPGLRAWRLGPVALVVAISIAPFYLVDDLTVTYDAGAILLGVWIGLMDRVLTTPRVRPPVTGPVSPHAPPSSSTSA